MTVATTVYPYSSVVYITDVIGGVRYQASGVLIAPNEVLTASHVLYQTGIGTATNIEVSPGFSAGLAPFGTIAGTAFHYNAIDDSNDQIGTQQSQLDFAVIHLASSVANAGTMGLLGGFAGGTVNITGYPGSDGGGQVQAVQNAVLEKTYSILDSAALGAGSSGGPLWVTSAGSDDVVGLVSSASGNNGYNVQLTNDDIATIEAWVAQDNPVPVAPVNQAAVVMQLYATVLGRSVDPAGLASWEAALSHGLSAAQMRVDLATSGEAQGDLQAAYQNELGRAGDAGGLAYFTQALSTTASLAGVRGALASSGEAQADLTTLYQNVLGRAPDSGGLAYFTQSLSIGGSLAGVRATLAYSGEAAADINTLYQNELARPADSGGLAYFEQSLAGGGSLSGISQTLAASAEATARVTVLLQQDFGTPPTMAAINAAQLQLTLGLTFAQLATQETILAASPTVLVDNGQGVDPGAGPTLINETKAGIAIFGFKQPDIIEFTTAQFANYQTILSSILPSASTNGGFEIFSHQNGQTVVALEVLPGFNGSAFTLTATNFRFV